MTFEYAHAILLAVHLLAVNVAAAGPLVAAWLLSGARDELRTLLGRRLLAWSFSGLCVGGLLGGVMLIAADGGLRSALTRFPASTYWFAATELLFSAACIAIMLVATNTSRTRPAVIWLLGFASATNLLYHFPPLMAVIGKLASNPRWAAEDVIARRTLLKLAARPEILALWAHFVLASVAVAAITALWPSRNTQSALDSRTRALVTRRLAAAALGASALQIPVGAWVLGTTSGAARNALLGSDAATSVLFLAGLIAAIALLQTLAAIAMGEASPGLCRRSGWLLVAVAVLMSATLTISRRTERAAAGTAHLEPTRLDRRSTPDYFGGSGSFEASSSVPPGNSPLAMISA